MPRLSAPPSRLSAAPARLDRPPVLDQGPAPRPRDTAPWKAWYKTPRWKRLRLQILIRDGYTCQRTGQICAGKYPADDSPTVNHRKPHRGDPILFWDPDNLETVTKATHDSLIQREEQATAHHRGVWA